MRKLQKVTRKTASISGARIISKGKKKIGSIPEREKEREIDRKTRQKSSGQEKNPKLRVSSFFHIYGRWVILG